MNVEKLAKIACPCGLNKTFEDCCGPYIAGFTHPKTAEALMRSRYTAFTLGAIDYIKATMSKKALIGFNPEQTLDWTMSVKWLGLKIIETDKGQAKNKKGMIHFIARFRENGKAIRMEEKSLFEKTKAGWSYIGEAP